MSTAIYDTELDTELYEKEDIVYLLHEAYNSVKNQIESGCDIIEIQFCGIEIELNYETKEFRVIA